MLILKRHISYILAYFACNFYLLIQGAQHFLYEWGYMETVAEGTWWINVSEILYFSQGVIMPALRLVEPYFFFQAWRNFRDFFMRLFSVLVCKKYDEEVYDPLVVGAKFIDKSDVKKYKNSKKAKKLQKYKTEEEFLFGIEGPANADSVVSSINDDEAPLPTTIQTRKSTASSL